MNGRFALCSATILLSAATLTVQVHAQPGVSGAEPQQPPKILPTPQDIQTDGRILNIRHAIIATDGTVGMMDAASFLARKLKPLLGREISIAIPQEDPGRDVSLIVIGNPERITWLSGIRELWKSALPAARANPEGYFLVTTPSRDRNYIICASQTPRGAYHAVQSLLQIIEPGRGPSGRGINVPRVNISDWPAFKHRGIIEGFYGTPWSWAQREAMIEFAGRHKMNWFILAPKDEPWHRSHWQIPHSPEELYAIQRLNQVAQTNQVNFCYAISPGRSIRFSDPIDLELLLSKAEAVQRLGVKAFALLMDDIRMKFRNAEDRRRFNTISDAHVYLAVRFYRAVKKRDPNAHIFFCPTKYHGAQPSISPYIRSIGQRLPSDVQIFWTGPSVVSMSLSESDSDVVAATLKRQPFYWDNFPVNDYDRTRLFLGPLAQRAPMLHEHCAGLVANPMNEAEASKLPLMTVADYLWNPTSYSPQRSWELAVTRLTDPELTPSLRVIAQLSAPNRFWQHDGLNLSDRVTQFWASVNAGNGDFEIRMLRQTFVDLREHAAIIGSKTPSGPLSNDLRRLVSQTYDLAALGRDALDVVESYRHGDPNYSILSQAFRLRLSEVETEQSREGLVSCPALDTLREFVRQCATLTSTNRVQRITAAGSFGQPGFSR